MALSGPAEELVQKLKATIDCGFALLMWAVGVRSSGLDMYAVRRRAGRCHYKLYAMSMSLWYDICIQLIQK